MEIICYTDYLPEGEEQNISFMELLLDDNWANGTIACPETVYRKIGDRNTKLSAKRNYEFLLRAAKKFSLKAVGITGTTTMDETAFSTQPDEWEAFRTDCYIAGKYQQELLDSGYFNPVIETLLANASQFSAPEEATLFLEKMISHAPEYYEIDDNTCPILLYKGSDICCNTLNLFIQELADALRSYRQQVLIFDIESEGHTTLTRFIGHHFKAVIGIQTYVFSILMQDNTTYLHDLIIGPKFNMILDHPAWLREHITHAPKDYYLLTHDRNYLTFTKKYFGNVKDCYYFPPAGTLPSMMPSALKSYDVTFIGSYRNYRERLKLIRSYDRKKRFFASRFIGFMKKYPNLSAEKAFQKTLDYYQMDLNDAEFLDLFCEMKHCCFCIMLYYREKIMYTLLNAGIEVHVFSERWENAPFAKHNCLFCHSEIDVKESLHIMQQSRISLNIMSWHKDGITERLLNAMLCQSVVLSDRSTALEENFENGKDLILFDLTELDTLPLIIKDLLADSSQLLQITASGFHKAGEAHQWSNRAEQLLQILDN